MVNAQAVDNPGVDKLKDQAVRVCEYRLILYPHADQPGDFKKRRHESCFGASRRHQPPALRLVDLSDALAFGIRAGIKRIGGIIVNQRRAVGDTVTFQGDSPRSSSASKVSPRNGNVSGRDQSISKYAA